MSRITRCEKHPQQEIHSYRHTDKLAVCSECVIDFHKGHDIDRLANVVQGFKEEISKQANKVCFFFFLFSFFHSLIHCLSGRMNR